MDCSRGDVTVGGEWTVGRGAVTVGREWTVGRGAVRVGRDWTECRIDAAEHGFISSAATIYHLWRPLLYSGSLSTAALSLYSGSLSTAALVL
ncbi:hypothetical protein [Paenibacillus sp. PK3_47]|uniref:hypothetical protein n=1 Tax=Paenibacillus sp. PK3_47 TaxID=2072642 RepID=UPI00201D716B|nr:hypothetical protein [Paenibacillus sp. PK3_47]